MSMRNKQAFHTILIIDQISKIRNNHFNSKLIRIWIFQTTFQNKDIIIIFDDIHVFSIFVQTTESKNSYSTHIFPPIIFQCSFLRHHYKTKTFLSQCFPIQREAAHFCNFNFNDLVFQSFLTSKINKFIFF